MKHSLRLNFCIGLFAACLAAAPGGSWAQVVSNSSDVSAPRPAPFAADIQAFRQRDATNRPAEQIIEFVGSSTIRLWATLPEDMAPMPVFNRGFGGSKTTDLLYYMDDIVLSYKPRVIVLYCGTNDFDPNSKDGKDVYDRTCQFFERVAARLPDTKIVYISIVRSPIRKMYWDYMNDANSRIQKYCASHPNVSYVDINASISGADGQPREEFFQNDRLHFNKAGYHQIAGVIKPAVQAVYKTK